MDCFARLGNPRTCSEIPKRANKHGPCRRVAAEGVKLNRPSLNRRLGDDIGGTRHAQQEADLSHMRPRPKAAVVKSDMALQDDVRGARRFVAPTSKRPGRPDLCVT